MLWVLESPTRTRKNEVVGINASTQTRRQRCLVPRGFLEVPDPDPRVQLEDPNGRSGSLRDEDAAERRH
jgi:hypothetical protein